MNSIATLARANTPLRATVRPSIEDVPPGLWARVTPPEFFFHPEFLRVMERSRVEGAEYRYITLDDRGEPVAAAVLSRFTLALDLLSGDPIVRALRRWIPGVLDVQVVCCGIPASFGQYHLHAIHPRYLDAAFDAVDALMEEWAAQTGAGLVVWKEWRPAQVLAERARSRGYVVLPTLPDHEVGPLPGDIGDFARGLRSAYRRKFRRALSLSSGNGTDPDNGGLRLTHGDFGYRDLDAFYRGYASVMERTDVRLETYPRGFFESLAAGRLPVRLLTLQDPAAGESIAAILIPSGTTLAFALVSKDRPRYREPLYALLLQCIVLRAIRDGFRTARLGQTSSYAKLSVGARPCRLETFLRLRTPWKHLLLSRFGHLLFPEASPPTLRVLQTGGGGGTSPHTGPRSAQGEAHGS